MKARYGSTEKEAQELARLNREAARPKGLWYLLFRFICVPFMALSLPVLLTKVKETKNVDLDSITAETYQ